MPIQNAQINGMGGGSGAGGSTASMLQRAAKKDSDTATALTAVNSVGASALAFIPVVGPILSALAGGIGAAVNAKAQDDAKKKMARADQLGQGGGSAMGPIQATQIGQSPQQQQPPLDTTHINSFLSSLGQTKTGGYA